MNRLAFPLAALVALSACTPAAPPPPPLAGATIGGPFALTDQDGKPRRDADFAGRYRIVYFGYTFCPDICPTDVANLARGLALFRDRDAARAAKVAPIFITVDPARDTPAAVRQFVRAFGPEWTGLTGTPADIAAAAKAYGVIYKAQPPVGDAPGYLVDHSRLAYLMGPGGEPIALLSQEGSPAIIAGELAKWVR